MTKHLYLALVFLACTPGIIMATRGAKLCELKNKVAQQDVIIDHQKQVIHELISINKQLEQSVDDCYDVVHQYKLKHPENIIVIKFPRISPGELVNQNNLLHRQLRNQTAHATAATSENKKLRDVQISLHIQNEQLENLCMLSCCGNLILIGIVAYNYWTSSMSDKTA